MSGPGTGHPSDDGGSIPGWKLWVSASGRHWAMREDVLSPGQIADGSLPLLHAEDAAALAARIREQETLRQLEPGDRLSRGMPGSTWPGRARSQ
jgi:hypothetical protein